MKHVTISKTETHSAIRSIAAPASRGYRLAYKNISPELAALIHDERKARQALDGALQEGLPLRMRAIELRKQVDPTDAELRGAMDAVPAPEILNVAASEPHATSVTVRWSDGEVKETVLDGGLTLTTADSIANHFRDTELRGQALDAFNAWQRDRMKAVTELHVSRRQTSAELQEAEKVADAFHRTVVNPARERHKLAERALYAYDAETPEDRFAQILALFEIPGGRISQGGRTSGLQDVFADGEPESQQLAAMMFRYLAAAIDDPACVILSGQEAVRMQWDQARAAALHAAE